MKKNHISALVCFVFLGHHRQRGSWSSTSSSTSLASGALVATLPDGMLVHTPSASPTIRYVVSFFQMFFKCAFFYSTCSGIGGNTQGSQEEPHISNRAAIGPAHPDAGAAGNLISSLRLRAPNENVSTLAFHTVHFHKIPQIKHIKK